jgi:formylglycine-generating enzyme required for sulfatase activity
MIDVAGGTYMAGEVVAANNDGIANQPIDPHYHGSITLSSFKMSETEITQAQFSAVMGVNPSYFACGAGGEISGGINYRPTSALPVESMTWYHAFAYCNKLSIAEGKTPCYSVNGISDWENLAYSSIPFAINTDWNNITCNFAANGYRLPTIAEFEFAARGGNLSLTALGTPPDYFYAGSNTANDVIWYNGNNGTSGATSAPWYGTKDVKSKAPNALGLYGMSGNVVEYCWTWYVFYDSSCLGNDPVGPLLNNGNRFAAGTAWNTGANLGCVNKKQGYASHNAGSEFGFRVVCRP